MHYVRCMQAPCCFLSIDGVSSEVGEMMILHRWMNLPYTTSVDEFILYYNRQKLVVVLSGVSEGAAEMKSLRSLS